MHDVTAPLNQIMGAKFEERFRQEAIAQGLYIQKMPEQVGFDFLMSGFPDGLGNRRLNAVECKCVQGGRLRVSNFTPIELRVAEDMYAKNIPYLVITAYADGFGVVPWEDLRKSLIVAKQSWNCAKAMEIFREKQTKV